MGYVSSIINQYGDNENVKNDSKALKDIIDRQGNKLLIHAIAEHIGNTNVRFNYTDKDITNIIDSLVNELKESILERV